MTRKLVRDITPLSAGCTKVTTDGHRQKVLDVTIFCYWPKSQTKHTPGSALSRLNAQINNLGNPEKKREPRRWWVGRGPGQSPAQVLKLHPWRNMDQREKFLNLKSPPARLNVQEAAWFLGFAAHDIPILVAKGLLKPLGHPASNATKFFATTTLQELRENTQWLSRATDTVTGYWRERNARRRGRSQSNDQQGEVDEMATVLE